MNIPIYNYTPHNLDIVAEDDVVSIAPTGLARVEQKFFPHPKGAVILGDSVIPLVTSTYGSVVGLEKFDWDQASILVVSIVVAHAIRAARASQASSAYQCRGRGTTYIATPARLVRHEEEGPMKGQVKGCEALEIIIAIEGDE